MDDTRGSDISKIKVLVMQLPSPPGLDVNRDYAGGYGVAVHVPRSTYGHDGTHQELMPNVVLSHATGVLREAGHRVEFCDAQVERLDENAVLNRIGGSDPDLLVTCLNLPSLDGDRHLLRVVRRNYPCLQIVASGTVCKALPEEALRDGLVDLAPVSEEETVIELAAGRVAEGRAPGTAPGGFVWRDGTIVPSGPVPVGRSLDEIPFPAYDLMPMKHYRIQFFGRRLQYAPIYTSRGCPFPCSYCPYPLGLGKKARFRTPSRVIEEIELVHTLGAEALVFRDQTYTLNRRHAETVCDLLAAKKLGMKWICETRVDLVTPELLRKMRAAGCRGINFGMETGDPDLLARVGKPGATFEDLKRGISITRKSGFLAEVHLIVGLPGETWETIHRTLAALHELKVDNADFNIITPYPGTPLFAYAKEHNLISARSWSEFTSVDPVMRTENMTIEELKRAQLYLDWGFRRGGPATARWVRRLRSFRYQTGRLGRTGNFVRRSTREMLRGSRSRTNPYSP